MRFSIFKRDFTLSCYRKLLMDFGMAGYAFQTVKDFVLNPLQKDKVIILRHDIDKRPENALRTAIIESELNICATYYFRSVSSVFNKRIIKQVADLSHEIGYHYENMTTCKGDMELAYNDFKQTLNKFNSIISVRTICMHGSPLSKFDNKDLWKKYDYRPLGVVAEPYFDIDYNSVWYLTDTGRRWNGNDVSIRDKIYLHQDKLDKPGGHACFQELVFDNSFEIMAALECQRLPDKIMMNTHPQRWDDQVIPWLSELFWQNIKNNVKKRLIAKHLHH